MPTIQKQLPFNKAIIGGTTIDRDEFVTGSGNLDREPDDTAVSTADGVIHRNRRAISASTTFTVFGDKRSLNGAVGFGSEAAVYYTDGITDTPLQAGVALITVTYSDDEDTSEITLTWDADRFQTILA